MVSAILVCASRKYFIRIKISRYSVIKPTVVCYRGKIHDDVIKWKHFPRHWPFVRGSHWSPVNSPHKGQWRGALMFSLISVWIYGWVNNREAGDLRRYRAHYDVTVMIVENITNLTGIIVDSVPLLKNYLIGVEATIIWDKGFNSFLKNIFGTTVTSFSKICWFRRFINCSRPISLPSLGVPFYLSLFIRAIQHIFLMNNTPKATVHIRQECLLLHRGVFVNDFRK